MKTKQCKYHDEYERPQRFIFVNDNDPDLTPIKIPLPKAPPLEEIDGYGLPPKEQKFKRSKIPKRLKQLQREIGDITEIQNFLEDNQFEYEKEIEFIEREWERRENGYWFFNNGVPTYITGTNYLYITWWEIDIGVPDYRDRDRKFFLFADFCENDPTSFGFTYPKHRREGATNKVQCWIYDGISKNKRWRGGIQSATEPHAKDVFQKHLVIGWRNLPFFFQPIFQGTTDPKKELLFSAPARRVVKGKISTLNEDALDSSIDFKSSDVKAYDSRKLQRYHGDEVGKTTEVNIHERHAVVKQCLSTGQGKIIIGKCIYTSTVGEMEKGGGAAFKKLCEQSHYEKRNQNGQTLSGCYNLFLPAYEGLEGFIDEYGNSLSEEALKHIQNTRQGFIDEGDFESLAEITRQYPIRFRECFRGDANKCKFNMKILEEQLEKFTFGNDYLTVGNFVWKDGVVDSRVVFEPNPNGKFKVSFLFPDPADSNRSLILDGVKIPDNIQNFVAGGDPFKFKTTQSHNKSDGGGAVFMKRQYALDPETKDATEWTSHRFCCTYRHRPRTKEEYCEDMLMMCVYYGCEMVTEINVDAIWEHFEKRNYGGYLYYQVDKKTGKYKKTPGIYTGTDAREEIFREYHSYIERHGYREVHDDLLRECLEIEDDMGDYDLFAAGGMALIGAKSQHTNQEIKDTVDIGDYIQTFSYTSN